MPNKRWLSFSFLSCIRDAVCLLPAVHFHIPIIVVVRGQSVVEKVGGLSIATLAILFIGGLKQFKMAI
jgi:hypothetical protein